MPRLGLGQSLTGGAVSESPTNLTYLEFDGTNDTVDMTSKVEIQVFTLSAWVKQSATSSYAGVCGNCPSNGRPGYRLGITNNGEVHGLVGNLTTGSYVYINGDTTAIDDDDWHLISTSYDGEGTLKVYLDGEDDGGTMALYNRSDSDITIQFSANFKVGAWTNNASYFDGGIDEVSLFNKVLTSGELETLYGSGDPAFAGDASSISDLVGYWRFEEGTGTSAADSSDTGDDGSLANGTAWATH